MHRPWFLAAFVILAMATSCIPEKKTSSKADTKDGGSDVPVPPDEHEQGEVGRELPVDIAEETPELPDAADLAPEAETVDLAVELTDALFVDTPPDLPEMTPELPDFVELAELETFAEIVDVVETIPEEPVEFSCGDGLCTSDNGENCINCEEDCGPCAFACGNGICELGESPEECAIDCGPCGDDVCGKKESAKSCPQDCAPNLCGDAKCEAPETATPGLPESCLVDCGVCGDGVCGFKELLDPVFEVCKSMDCTTSCGDGMCKQGESVDNCLPDCGYCGDGICSIIGVSIENCPLDCVKPCGDGICSAGETQYNCPVDCGYCGDEVCGKTEMNQVSCPVDCPVGCGNGACEEWEDAVKCPADCGCLPYCEEQWQCGISPNCEDIECGQCLEGDVCLDHMCCIPDCEDKECGDDGCDGTCGDCADSYCEDHTLFPADMCDAEGACVPDGVEQDCCPYLCAVAGDMCLAQCAGNEDCCVGYVCNVDVCELE